MANTDGMGRRMPAIMPHTSNEVGESASSLIEWLVANVRHSVKRNGISIISRARDTWKCSISRRRASFGIEDRLGRPRARVISRAVRWRVSSRAQWVIAKGLRAYSKAVEVESASSRTAITWLRWIDAVVRSVCGATAKVPIAFSRCI